MQLRSDNLTDGQPIPARHAFCQPAADGPVELAPNVSPHLAWSEVPEGTAGFALVVVDPDAPTVADDVNQEGRTVSADLPRADFHHWALVDLPADCRELAEGACSDGVTAKGKQDPPGPVGSRQGRNDYTGWFAGDPDMGGTYHGYDGPAPPWNDERVHRYHFRLLALDVPRLDVGDGFDVPAVLAAAEGHVLAEATLTGTYTLNPALRG